MNMNRDKFLFAHTPRHFYTLRHNKKNDYTKNFTPKIKYKQKKKKKKTMEKSIKKV